MVPRHSGRCSTNKALPLPVPQGYLWQRELWQGKLGSNKRQALDMCKARW